MGKPDAKPGCFPRIITCMDTMLPASRFYRAVRSYAVTAPVWEPSIRHFVTPDEKWDLTLVAFRVYGNRDEVLAIMAAAGLSRFDDPLEAQELVLPNAERLQLIKEQSGYVSAESRSVR